MELPFLGSSPESILSPLESSSVNTDYEIVES